MEPNPALDQPGEATEATAGRSVAVPDRPALEGLEDKWVQRWRDEKTYAFDRTKTR